MVGGRGIRRGLKRIVESTIVRSGLPKLKLGQLAGQRLILAYHNVVPSGRTVWGERSLHITRELFRRHLDVISGMCHVVPLPELLNNREAAGGTASRPFVSITFDDAYRGAAQEGVEDLESFNIPATYFVVPGLGEQPGFWWDLLAETRGGQLPPELRRRALEEFRGCQDEVLKNLGSSDTGSLEPPAYARPSSCDELRELGSRPGIHIGCHTWSHPNLTRLTVKEQMAELERAQEWLRAEPRALAGVLSYPYGLHDPLVQESARQAGFDHALRIDGGWLSRAGSPDLAVPRLNVPSGLSPDGLKLRLSRLRGSE